jgi:putative lipase involved disintegration of autophagic bodies
MSDQSDIQEISIAVAREVTAYAMLSSNAYHKSDRIRFPIETLGWTLVDADGSETTRPTKETGAGLAYDIYEKAGTNDVVFAFRGTDDLKDYLTANLAIGPFAPQYRQAKKDVARYLATHSNKNVVATGHSLGGGLSLSVSVHHGVRAITFDSSPRVFDGLGDFHEPAERLVVFQQGEILQVFRKHWNKLSEVVEAKNIYRCAFEFPKGVNPHRSDYLALGLLRFAAPHDVALKRVLDSLPQ